MKQLAFLKKLRQWDLLFPCRHLHFIASRGTQYAPAGRMRKKAMVEAILCQLGHTYFDSGNKVMAGVNASTRQLVIPFARDYKSYVVNRGDNSARLVTSESNKVFIVHGHDECALHGLARFLEKLGLEAIVLKQQPNQGRTIIEKYEDYANEVGFAVVLLTPDDRLPQPPRQSRTKGRVRMSFSN